MKKEILLRTIIVFCALALAAGFTGCGPREQTIKIGFSIPLTGDNPMVGEGSKNTGEIIKEAINGAGGLDVGGTQYKLEFIYLDNELKAENAVLTVTQLIDQNKVLAVIGPQGSGRAIPAGEICNDRRTPMVSAWSTNPDTTKNRPYVFRACFIDPFQAPVAARFTKDKFGVSKVAILYNVEDDYSKTLAELYRDSWNSNYGEVVAWESFGQKDQDFNAQLTNILVSGADILYVPVYYNFLGNIVPQAKALGWDKPIMGADAWGSADLWKVSDGSVAGYYFTTHYAAAGAVGQTREFIDTYNAKYGYIPDDVAALTYDAVNIVLESIRNAGITGNLERDRDNLKDAIAGLKNFEGITGKMSFTPDGDPQKEAVVVRISDSGEFVYEASLTP
ncbi:MAG: ABC transporter substrate-binding protein [Spirochaetaceae bacterium]|jgi:branched-chain amino acid transport system substrate-binding protein|nr:ABC transporter substrate-binding protein [Spirochaetaceae bacterium]